LKASGLAWTILRPNEFMSNAYFWRDTVKSQGVVYAPTGDGKHAAIDPLDIAAVAAKALTTSGHEGKTYALTGPEALSTAEQAAKLGAAIGRDVRHVDMPSAAFREQLANMGLPPVAIDPLANFYDLVRQGKLAYVHPTVEQVTGRPARGFADWARDHAAAFA
jgi:uncharacterized protein YbjT (DUF2867 family)